MNWRTIKHIRPLIEKEGYFVEEITEDYILCTHLDDKEEIFYHIYAGIEKDYMVFQTKANI